MLNGMEIFIEATKEYVKSKETVPMSVIEDIKAEIEQTAKDFDKFDDYRRVRGLWIALEIIDKHISGKEQE